MTPCKIVEFVEEFLPRLEHADFIKRYSWFVTRYYENERCPDPDNEWFCLDNKNSLNGVVTITTVRNLQSSSEFNLNEVEFLCPSV